MYLFKKENVAIFETNPNLYIGAFNKYKNPFTWCDNDYDCDQCK